MEFICHRVNTKDALENVDLSYGVEIDLRDENDQLILSHDPFSNGETFESYLERYKHGTLILNIKSERIEHRVLELIQKHKIGKYFFLDSSFPMIHLLSNQGERNIALRYSEFEGMDVIRNMAGRVDWIWIDCFTKFPLTKDTFSEMKALGYKLCLVSPELQGRDDEIELYKALISERGIHFDAICTKSYNISRWI
ncbi:MAG TPA: hypothetical protein DCS67_04890 [Clostridiales bacterium UBA8960]|nr:hypothetical protein [Clostridiales bacterium UBA8960]